MLFSRCVAFVLFLFKSRLCSGLWNKVLFTLVKSLLLLRLCASVLNYCTVCKMANDVLFLLALPFVVCLFVQEWEEKRRQNIEKMNEEMERIAEYERGQRVRGSQVLQSFSLTCSTEISVLVFPQVVFSVINIKKRV